MHKRDPHSRRPMPWTRGAAVALALGTAAMTAGCNTTDPRQGGFIGGVGGVVGGSYARGVEDRRTQRDELAAINAGLKEELSDIRAERSSVAARQRALESRLTEIKDKLRRAELLLDQARRNERFSETEYEEKRLHLARLSDRYAVVAQHVRDVADAQAATRTGTGAIQPASYSASEDRQRALQEEVEVTDADADIFLTLFQTPPPEAD